MGTFVSNVADPPFEWGEDQGFGSSGAYLTRDLVQTQFDTSVATAEDMLTRLVGSDGNSGYLGNLNSVLADFPAPSIDSISITDPTLGITPDSRPTISMDTIDTAFPTFDATAPPLMSLPTVDLSSLNPADLPDDVSAAISWLEEAHDNQLFTILLSNIITGLGSGATGLPTAVEQSIYDRASARQDVIESDQEEEVLDYFSTRGFPRPTGALAGAIAELASKKALHRTDLNEKILEEQARLEQSNRQFILTAAKDLEAVLRDFTNKTNDRNLDYEKAVAANAISLYSEAVRAYIASVEANKAYVEIQVENLKASVEYNKGLVASFSAEVDAYNTQILAISNKNKAVTDVFDSEIKGYDSETRAISANQDILLREYLAKLQGADIDIRAQIAEADNITKGYIAEGSLKERVSADMANIAMQSVASAYGMVNMSAQLSDGTSRRSSESVSHGDNRSVTYGKREGLTEAHHYEEEVT